MRNRLGRKGLLSAAVALASAVAALGGEVASAQVLLPGVDPGPIPSANSGGFAQFEGEAVEPDPFSFPETPEHPFMAPNGKSNIHVDAFQTDTNTIPGPLGETATDSIYFVHECASITFDSQGRIVSICVGLERPILALLNPDTLVPLATYELPPRQIDPGGNPFTDFSGGGYFYLDDQDRAVMPTAERHVLVIGQTDEPDFEVVEDYDLNGVVASDDKVISALPDWKGRIWFISVDGVVGWISPGSGAIHSKDLGDAIGNSFAVDEKGSVYVVTDAALYRLRAKKGKVREEWRRKYPNTGDVKPGQTQAGSGTTPTLLAGGKLVAITDNADPMNVHVYRRAVHTKAKRRVCKEPLFEPGASATDQSLIGAGRSIIAENNYGYSIPATQGGGTSTPGLQKVKVNKKLDDCRTVWRSEEIAPSVVPKASAKTGLVYTYTKPGGTGDPWYLTALDFRTGETRWKRLAGTGLGFNNNYAPITIGPDGRIYLGVLGGMVAFFP
ncbi:MAG TPA: hypothetical protein VD766_02115 [Solirubrobacterales bacterium]|nr:hypothetical protein [Solirubrobacterales bacterium]